MLRIAFEANSRNKQWVAATGMMESVKDGSPATPSDLGYTGVIAMLGGGVWFSAEIAMNPEAAEVAETARRQVDQYAGQAAMMALALPDYVRGVFADSNGNGNHSNGRH